MTIRNVVHCTLTPRLLTITRYLRLYVAPPGILLPGPVVVLPADVDGVDVRLAALAGIPPGQVVLGTVPC